MITISGSRVAFEIGSIGVAWYGIFVALAVLVVVLWTMRAARRDGRISLDIITNAALIGVPAGIVGARLAHVIDYWKFYQQNPGQIIGGAGLAIWGAVLGATLAIWIYSRVKKFSFGYMADLIAPGIILGQAVGRVGCVFNGCCYGVITTGPLGIIYTNLDSFADRLGVPFQPTQIYEIIYNVMAFVVLLRLRNRLKPDGALFLVYLIMYSIWRFAVDFIRDGTPFLFGLHEAQVIALGVLAVCIPLLVFKVRWNKPEVAVVPETVSTEE